MLIECIGEPFICRWPGGEVRLAPGQPVEIPDDRARRLLVKAPGRVRAVDAAKEPVVIEDAHPQARSVYWESGTGEILGPATPEYLARQGDTFWIVTAFEGQPRWINADRLRSRTAFETQRKPVVVELIKEPRSDGEVNESWATEADFYLPSVQSALYA
jgi:hypothetical protein